MIKLRGTIQLTGPHGAGKSEFALQYGDLTKTCLLDDDIKGRSTYEVVNEILKQSGKKFGRYVDIIEYLGGTLKAYDRYEQLNKLIDALEYFETIIIDTWSQWGNICREYAKHNPEMFRKPTKNRAGQEIYRSGNSQIMQGEISADGRELEAVMIEKLRSKCETLFLITHLKPFYHNNINTLKEVPIQSKLLDRVCEIRMWVRQNPKSAVPIGLVIKRSALRKIGDDGRMETVNFLPQKLTPTAEDKSLWDVIQRYADDPMGNRTPTADETPNEIEMSILENTLTAEQRRIYEYGARAVNGLGRTDKKEEDQVISGIQEAMNAAVKEQKAQGLAAPAILDNLKPQYPDLTIPAILQVN